MKALSSTFRSLFHSLMFALSLGASMAIFANMSYAQQGAGAEPIDINTATAEQLAVTLDGVGMSKAMAIVEHRKRYGEFKHVDSLVSVKGIGQSTLEKNRARIKVD